MSRLPIPGNDDDVWGNILNDFLDVEHNTDGSLKLRSDGTLSQYYVKPSNGIPTGDMNSIVAASLSSADHAVQSVNGKTGQAITLAAGDIGAVPASTVTAKGDLLVGTAPATLTSESVGSDGQVLTADSTKPAGVAWGTPNATDPNAVHKGDLVLNVKDYGATGNGVADDTTAIQNCVNAAAAIAVSTTSTGATVYFPTGTYLISSAIVLGASSLTLRGAGFRSSTIVQSSTTAHGFYALNLREFVFSDLMLQGPGSGSGNGIFLAASGTNAVFDCVFTNLHITSFGGHGIQTQDLCTSLLSHVRVESCLGDGFHISDNGSSGLGGTSVTLVACYANSCTGAGYFIDALKYTSLISCATDACNYGYWVNRSSGIALNGCGVEATSGSKGHGFMIANGTTSATLSACWATNLVTSTGIGYNVTNNGGSPCTRIVITGCRIQGGIAPLYSASVDSNCQAVFIGFQAHPSAGSNILGTSQFIAHENTGLTAYGQMPAAGDEPFVSWLPDTASYGFSTAVKADTVKRWALRSDGKTEWGTGAASRDTNLYRSAASTLRTDSTFVAANVNVGSPSAAAKIYATYADSSAPSVGFQMQETAGTQNGTAMQIMQAASTSKRVLDLMVTGDTSRRLSINAGGTLNFGDGTTLDTNLYRSAAATLATDDQFAIRTAGKGLSVKEGSNAKMGTATLVGGTVTIGNTSVTATSRIFLTTYIAGGTVGALYVSAKVAGTSFSVTSTSATDTSTFNYLIVEPSA